MLQAEDALAEADSLKCAADFVAAHADRWWQLDRLHLCALAGAGKAQLETVRQLADQAYFDCVARVADRFSALVEREGGWPPDGTTGVATLRDSLWKPDGRRRGVIVTDACRWDVAQDLGTLLEGQDYHLAPVLSTLPSHTPFGMTALLPPADGLVKVEFGGGKPKISQGNAKNLDTRDGRKAFLRAAVVDATGQPLVDFVDLDVVLKGERYQVHRLSSSSTTGSTSRGTKGLNNFRRSWKRSHAICGVRSTRSMRPASRPCTWLPTTGSSCYRPRPSTP